MINRRSSELRPPTVNETLRGTPSNAQVLDLTHKVNRITFIDPIDPAMDRNDATKGNLNPN